MNLPLFSLQISTNSYVKTCRKNPLNMANCRLPSIDPRRVDLPPPNPTNLLTARWTRSCLGPRPPKARLSTARATNPDGPTIGSSTNAPAVGQGAPVVVPVAAQVAAHVRVVIRAPRDAARNIIANSRKRQHRTLTMMIRAWRRPPWSPRRPHHSLRATRRAF